MLSVQDNSDSSPGDALLAPLDHALQAALLPLAFEALWHPVEALELAPDLPEDWFRTVTRTLNLPVEGNRAPVPEAVQQVLRRRLSHERPRLYRELAGAAADRAFAADDVQLAMTLLHAGGLLRQAEAGLVAWISRWDLANGFGTVNQHLQALPGACLTARVRGAWWHAQIRQGGEAGAQARREAQAAYDAGEREPEVVHALLLGHNFDSQHVLALALADELLAGGAGGLLRLRTLHQRAVALLDLGRLTEHRAAAEALIEEAGRQGRLDFIASGHAALAYALEEGRHWDDATWHYERATATSERIGHHRQLVVVLNNFAQMLAQAGRPAEARLKLEAARPYLSGHAAQDAWLALTRAIIDHQYGAHAEALISTRAAVQAAAAASLDGYQLSALLLETQRLALDGQTDAATSRFREARALLPAGDSHDATASRLTAAMQQYLLGQVEGAVEAFAGLSQDEHLSAWDQARLQLYLADGALHLNSRPDLEAVTRALSRAGTDAPLRTDAPRLSRVLDWLAREPGWKERLACALEAAPMGETIVLRFELYGPLVFQHAGGALPFPLQRSAELLAYLALHGPSTRQNLLTALFGHTDTASTDHFKKVLRGLRSALIPLLPPGTDAVLNEQRRYRLNPLIAVTCAWYPQALFPLAVLRTSGAMTVTGLFLDGVRGPWVDSLLEDAHEELVRELKERQRAGQPDAAALLVRAQAL
ncbi:hypothetical protein [Deinococcus sp. QL22]|uniref:hypothetical protein n=1 Tax=Deinococcus sp. QL22 TaxID=2939437 RepID=UPI002017D341|nr:hypothetical protein [Deinococcus sp. QL22]UQN06536.1 hypothetical protein M1R55_01040 [Deinococcus sp. QL22]